MTHRFLVSVGAVAGPIALALVVAVPVGGQAPSAGAAKKAAAKAYTAPRTPDGQPDLQGFWTNSTYTPLERPDGVTKEFYTPAEVDAIEKRGAARDAEQT